MSASVGDVFKPGQQVLQSGIYDVIHGSGHAKKHQVTSVHGKRFPPCKHYGFFRVALQQTVGTAPLALLTMAPPLQAQTGKGLVSGRQERRATAELRDDSGRRTPELEFSLDAEAMSTAATVDLAAGRKAMRRKCKQSHEPLDLMAVFLSWSPDACSTKEARIHEQFVASCPEYP